MSGRLDSARPLTPAELVQRQAAAIRHGGHGDLTVRRVATVQKRRLLRQIGLQANQLDGIGQAYLDSWARAQAKVELMDTWAAEHGWLDAKGSPPPFVAVYFTAINSARLALARLADHMRARGYRPSVVRGLQDTTRRTA